MTMRNKLHSSLVALAALGVVGPVAAQDADTSQWKCETCPYPKGTGGHVDVGLGSVSEASQSFGDYTGLERKRAHPVLGGAVLHRGPGGYWAEASADSLGLDSRSVRAQAGREGQYALRLGWAQTPRHFADDAATPFLGVGGADLTLPAGFPAATTGAMPLAGTLAPVRIGFDRHRFDLGGTWLAAAPWSVRASFRRDVRDGTRPVTASFFSTAAQMPFAVDEVTDEFEVVLGYHGKPWQGTLAYRYSQFDNQIDALTWSNPFNPVVAGATRGRMAPAPDNRMHQVAGSGGWQVMPMLRLSGDFAVARLMQNADYLPSTITSGLVVPGLPAASLDGRVDTFNGSVKATATPLAGLRVTASYARDVRDNRTSILGYPSVATDMFVDPTPRSNTPFSHWTDRAALGADWSGWSRIKLAAGVNYEERERDYHEVVTTEETTGWLRASVQALDNLSLGLKVSHAERDASTYGVATWFGVAENALLRRYNLAARTRDAASLRADLALGEKVSIGLVADYAEDDFDDVAIGLQATRSESLGADLAVAVSDATRITAFAQGERVRSRQAGSQVVGVADWNANVRDRFEVFGIGIKHQAIADKLDIGADLLTSRSRSVSEVQTGVGEPPFPVVKASIDSVRLYANYKLDERMTLMGSWWYETRDGVDWRYDGIGPATLPSVLAFGQTTPDYKVNVLRVSLRYRF